MIAPVRVDEAKITARGEERGGALSTFLAAYVVAFLIYLMTTLYGVAVMRSVLEEKTNRIAEVLMSTIRASHLIAGKIIGVGSAAVAQVLIWIVITDGHRHPVTPAGSALRAAGQRPAGAAALSRSPACCCSCYFLLGFFLYASVFATVGAAVTSEQEAQSVQFIALLPLISPLMFLESILNAPLGRDGDDAGAGAVHGADRDADADGVDAGSRHRDRHVARAAAGRHRPVAWMAGKVYRVGILSTGKRPTAGELLRWIKAA